MGKIRILFFTGLCLMLWSNTLLANKKIYTTKRVNPHAPVIDGHLDDPAWVSAKWGEGFIQQQPYDGREASQKTAFKILYDDNNLYVGIRAFDTHPDSIATRMSRRDDKDGDIVAVMLDSYFDHLTAFSFMVNAGGVKIDGVFTDDGQNEDYSWDPVWYVKTTVDNQGWTAEMKIPFSQLRFGKSKDYVWGLEVGRFLFRKEELSFWQPIPKDAPGLVHLFGELHGIHGIKPSRRIELLPYSVGKIETMKKEIGNPFSPGHLNNMSFGLDGKIGLTSDLTLDFTVNPDFGQVEADPSVVNLTAFETFYKEKRPFFIEGANILNYQLMIGDGDLSRDNLFYSRRIGHAPSYDPDINDDEHLKMPENSSILGALKLTGKTSKGLSIGVMDAVTAKENAEIDLNGQRRHIAVEPMTNYFLGRLQKDYNKGSTTIGGILTSTYRNIKDSQLEFLNRSAVTGGVDFQHQWKNRTYFLIFKSVFSHIAGTREALLEAQTAPSRYFQRPDADYVKLDSNRTSLSGYGGTFFIGRGGNSHLNFAVGSTWRSPGLELNDMGYIRQADNILEFAWIGYRIWEPFSIFRSVSVNFNQWSGWNFGRENIFNGGNINLHFQFRNYWGFGGGINRNGASLSTSALRGGPSMILPSRWNTWFNISSDPKRTFQFSFNGSKRWSNNGSYSYSFRPRITLRPRNTFSLSLNPFYQVNKDNLQYVDTVEKENENRYIFGQIDQKTFGMVLRFNYSITPTLTIQYYGQPFVSAGKYSHFKRITQPRARNYRDRFHTLTNSEIHYDLEEEEYLIDEDLNGTVDYSIGNPDFNFRQFRSNLVVRWEYTPGSTLYFVWSQGRTDYESTGNFSFRDDIGGLFNVYPQNVFLVKFNRWFSL